MLRLTRRSRSASVVLQPKHWPPLSSLQITSLLPLRKTLRTAGPRNSRHRPHRPRMEACPLARRHLATDIPVATAPPPRPTAAMARTAVTVCIHHHTGLTLGILAVMACLCRRMVAILAATLPITATPADIHRTLGTVRRAVAMALLATHLATPTVATEHPLMANSLGTRSRLLHLAQSMQRRRQRTLLHHRRATQGHHRHHHHPRRRHPQTVTRMESRRAKWQAEVRFLLAVRPK